MIVRWSQPKSAVQIGRKEILRYLGKRSGSRQLDERMREALTRAISLSRRRCEPMGLFRIVELEQPELQHAISSSQCVARLVRDASRAALAVCTIGPELEREVARLFAAGHYLEAMMLDSAGSVAAEEVAAGLHAHIEEQLGPTTARFSPGYGDLDVQYQRHLFTLLQPESVGIHLTASCLMTPRKSVSFITGVGFHNRLEELDNPCAGCDLEPCAYRKL